MYLEGLYCRSRLLKAEFLTLLKLPVKDPKGDLWLAPSRVPFADRILSILKSDILNDIYFILHMDHEPNYIQLFRLPKTIR